VLTSMVEGWHECVRGLMCVQEGGLHGWDWMMRDVTTGLVQLSE